MLLVGDEPTVIEPLQDQTVLAPTNAKLLCRLKVGEPKATLSWSKDGKAISSGNKYKTAFVDEEATLEILNTEPADSATYKLEAKNKVGQFSTQAKLTVHGECTMKNKTAEYI